MALQQNYTQPLGRADGGGGDGPSFALDTGQYAVPGVQVSGLDPGSLPHANPWQSDFGVPGLDSGENNVPGFISERVITINMVCAAQPDSGWTGEYYPGKVVFIRRASGALTNNDQTIVFTVDQINVYMRSMYDAAQGTTGVRATRTVGGEDGPGADTGMEVTDIDLRVRDAGRGGRVAGGVWPTGVPDGAGGFPSYETLEAEEPETYLHARRILQHIAYAGVIRAVSSRDSMTPVLSVQVGGPHQEVANYWGHRVGVLADVGFILKRYQDPMTNIWHEFQFKACHSVRDETDEDGFSYITASQPTGPTASEKVYYTYDPDDNQLAGKKAYAEYFPVGCVLGMNGQSTTDYTSREMLGLSQGGGARAGKNTARSAAAFKEQSAHSLIVAIKRQAFKIPRTRHDGSY
jgi:hypothetical protein